MWTPCPTERVDESQPPGVSASRSTAADVASLLRPWRVRALAVAGCVLAAASLELVPLFLVRVIVDDHLVIGRSGRLLSLAVLYLAATAAVQAMTFLYSYLAATIAQSVISTLRARLFAHLQRLPLTHLDRMPVGDAIVAASDVETLDVVFSSGIAVLVANLGAAPHPHGRNDRPQPSLALVAALVAPPLVIVLRVLQVRVRRAERATRLAVGALERVCRRT